MKPSYVYRIIDAESTLAGFRDLETALRVAQWLSVGQVGLPPPSVMTVGTKKKSEKWRLTAIFKRGEMIFRADEGA